MTSLTADTADALQMLLAVNELLVCQRLAGEGWPYRQRSASRERIYVAIQSRLLASEIEFDWDDENKKHLAAHKVAPAEFEQVLCNDPIDLAFDLIDDEDRYRSVGLTSSGRLLSLVWTIRNGKVRAITAFPASVSDRKAFLEKPK